GAANSESFFEALNTALSAWSLSMPNAVAAARDTLLRACGLPEGDEGFAALRAQAAALETRVLNQSLLPFLRRAAMPGDAQTVLDSVLALIASRPPRSWSDIEVQRFPAQAQTLGDLFQQAQRDFTEPLPLPVMEGDAPKANQIVAELR